jgi:hypothetical protein
MRKDPLYWIACTSIAFLLNQVGSGIAQDVDVEDVTREVCRPDAMRLCGMYIPFVDQITTCMTQHFLEVSPRCRVAMIKEDIRSRARLKARNESPPDYR